MQQMKHNISSLTWLHRSCNLIYLQGVKDSVWKFTILDILKKIKSVLETSFKDPHLYKLAANFLIELSLGQSIVIKSMPAIIDD